jgi:hypothetical protein
LLNEDNVSSTENETNPSLHCVLCDFDLGVADPTVSGWKLYKWSVQLRKDNDKGTVEAEDKDRNTNPPPQSFPAQKWMSFLLLSSSENTGVRRFIVEPTTPISHTKSSTPALLVRLPLSLLNPKTNT